jgi:hypothetical protein
MHRRLITMFAKGRKPTPAKSYPAATLPTLACQYHPCLCPRLGGILDSQKKLVKTSPSNAGTTAVLSQSCVSRSGKPSIVEHHLKNPWISNPPSHLVTCTALKHNLVALLRLPRKCVHRRRRRKFFLGHAPRKGCHQMDRTLSGNRSCVWPPGKVQVPGCACQIGYIASYCACRIGHTSSCVFQRRMLTASAMVSQVTPQSATQPSETLEILRQR